MRALHENHDYIINCKSHSLTLKAYITNINFLSAFKICYPLKCFEASTNRVDPDQTAPDAALGPHCLPLTMYKH